MVEVTQTEKPRELKNGYLLLILFRKLRYLAKTTKLKHQHTGVIKMTLSRRGPIRMKDISYRVDYWSK